MSQLTDIAWIANLPNLKRFALFDENVKDLTPLTQTHLESLSLWKMSHEAAVDLSFVAKIKGLKELEIDDMEVSHFEALSACTALEKIKITEAKGVGDLAAIKKLPKLKKLVVDEETPEATLKGFASGVEIIKN